MFVLVGSSVIRNTKNQFCQSVYHADLGKEGKAFLSMWQSHLLLDNLINILLLVSSYTKYIICILFFFSHCLPRWFLLYISSKKTFPRSSPGFWWVGGFMLCSASGFYCDLKTNGKKGQDSYISNICFTKFGVLKICESQVFK